VSELVLLPLWNLQGLFQLAGALLKIVVKDEVRKLILEALLACL
jgi:hypothetical protein